MGDNRNHNWTDERIAMLKKHFNDGLSARVSANLLGGVTRNAVIAKRWRTGLVARTGAVRVTQSIEGRRGATGGLRAPVVREVTSKASLRATATNLARQINTGTFKTVAPTPDNRPRAALNGTDLSYARPWTERTRGQCAFPVDGDGADVRSCCAPIEDLTQTGSYCRAHYAAMRTKAWGWAKAAECHPGVNRVAAA